MESPLRRSVTDTRRSFGFTWTSLARSVLVPAAAVLLILHIRGFEGAVNEAVDIALYALAFCGAAVIPVFLWNLWLAPYRMMHERLDEAIAANQLPGDPEMRRPGPVDVSAYDGTPVFTLGDAACLWVDIEPHNPITNPRALGAFTRLRGAVKAGALPANPGFGPTLAAIGGRSWWPLHDHPVSAVALRRYADQRGDVPRFLASVEIPHITEDAPSSDTDSSDR